MCCSASCSPARGAAATGGSGVLDAGHPGVVHELNDVVIADQAEALRFHPRDPAGHDLLAVLQTDLHLELEGAKAITIVPHFFCRHGDHPVLKILLTDVYLHRYS